MAKSNGKGKFSPSAKYRHLGADVWAKSEGEDLSKSLLEEEEDVAYTQELLEELDEDSESESNFDN